MSMGTESATVEAKGWVGAPPDEDDAPVEDDCDEDEA